MPIYGYYEKMRWGELFVLTSDQIAMLQSGSGAAELSKKTVAHHLNASADSNWRSLA